MANNYIEGFVGDENDVEILAAIIQCEVYDTVKPLIEKKVEGVSSNEIEEKLREVINRFQM